MLTVDFVKECIKKSDKEESKLNSAALKLPGMTSVKVKHLLNNLCSLEDCNYLEIGTWAGSTFCCAIHENEVNAFACDNWEQFEGPKDIFFKNLENHKGKNTVKFFEQDSFTIDLNELPKINVYFYDGGHDVEDHKRAFTHFKDTFADEIVVVVDDYGDDPPPGEFMFSRPNSVRFGTQLGLEEISEEFDVIYRTELPPFIKIGDPSPLKDYWNGLFVAYLRRKQ